MLPNTKTSQDAFFRVLQSRIGALPPRETTAEYLVALRSELLEFAHKVEAEIIRMHTADSAEDM